MTNVTVEEKLLRAIIKHQMADPNYPVRQEPADPYINN
jgi:hypothetical protein